MIQEIKLPEIAENVHSVVLVDIRVKQGDKIDKDQIIFDVETDKAAIEVPSEFDGVVKEIKVNIGDSIQVGAVVMIIETDTKASAEQIEIKTGNKTTSIEKSKENVDEKQEVEVKETIVKEKTTVTNEIKKEVPASPSVRKLAREIGVNIYDVVGTGTASRITEDDVKLHAKKIITEKLINSK